MKPMKHDRLKPCTQGYHILLLQLMSVFPAASRSHVPKPWAELMVDPECTIIDFYPEDFKIDLNGKKYAWQGVALLPFVDEVKIRLNFLQSYVLNLTFIVNFNSNDDQENSFDSRNYMIYNAKNFHFIENL